MSAIRPTLFSGNQNYSSWSLRGYLPLAEAGVEIDVEVIPLDTVDSAGALAAISPSGLVPALRLEGGEVIWESLAIAELAAERRPSLWPADPIARGVARAVTCQMHAGFAALRRDMPMNIRGRHPGVGHSAEALADAERVQALWRDCRQRFGGAGDFLFGEVSIADAFYAPVVTRFVTYGVELDVTARRYVDAVLAWPPMAGWIGAAASEPWRIAVAEPDDPRWAGGPR